MVSKKPRIVVIGAGMAGLTAANKLYTSASSKQLFELLVVEGGTRIGGRISSSEFCGDRIEQGATWIHGIEGSPVYKIAQDINSLQSDQPWECMDGMTEDAVTVAEGGHELNPSLVEPISTLFKNLMNFIQGEAIDEADGVASEVVKHCNSNRSVGSFLQQGLEAYWGLREDQNGVEAVGDWTRKELERAIFAMNESIQRTYTSADDLCTLDYNAESEYILFPGEEITIARGYSSVIESLASVLPPGMIQLGRKVEKIEWLADGLESSLNHMENGSAPPLTRKDPVHDHNRPVKLHFFDGSIMSADHVIVTVSLGVLKRGISQDSGLFDPPLPRSKTQAISRLGYGVVNKVFLKLQEDDRQNADGFPFLQMVFHQQQDSGLRHPKIPQWIRKTSFLCPIYSKSRVVLSWFAGKEALELETLTDEEIISGFSATISNLLPPKSHPERASNGTEKKEVKLEKVLRTQWGTNPLFLGSYSYVAVGSSTDDMDTLAEPLPEKVMMMMNLGSNSAAPAAAAALQILFAGEATHRTHYSTTHGAYFSGLREANRLLKYYNNFIGA